MKQIPLTNSKLFALVDDADYDYFIQWKWQAVIKKEGYNDWYACRHHKRKYVRMHREISKPPEGLRVDHIDGNTLNNQRNNLRNVTASQNSMNKKGDRNTFSKYKGAYFKKGKASKQWFSKIYANKKHIHLGYFYEEIEAARSYNEAAIKYFGEFACLNDIPSLLDVALK